MGTRESTDNFNSLIEGIISSSPPSDSDRASSPITLSDVSNSDKSNATITTLETSASSSDDLLKLILFKVDAIENYLIKLDVKIDIFRSPTGSSGERISGMADMGKLRELGLPADDLVSLQQLEQKLKEDEFKSKLVIENTFKFIYQLNMSSCSYNFLILNANIFKTFKTISNDIYEL